MLYKNGSKVGSNAYINALIEREPIIKRMMVEFVVVWLAFAHNIILGQPCLTYLRCFISMKYLCVKLRMSKGYM